MTSFSVGAAIARFKQVNAQDPNLLLVDGQSRPRELVQAERLAAWVERLEPNASEALRLAAHCQHLRRWEISRTQFAAGRVGYLTWRKHLSKFHADAATEILRELSADETTISNVRSINLKQGLSTNPDVQTMEDALCLTFLEHEAAPFAVKQPPAKVVEILRKTWAKMSDRGRQVALTVQLTPTVDELLKAALVDLA